MARGMTLALSGVFFASGASALILENLWFREAGLFLGNSVWATSLVLAAFMAGLALGSFLAARFGHRATRLTWIYGALELAVAVTGVGVILVLPALTDATAPLLAALTARPLALDAVRLLVAFVLMLIPTTAMGATLPVLVAALSRREPSFGRVLGTLYGWNTLGAVAGILACELVLVPWLGIRGSAGVAFVVSGGAGVVAIVLSLSLGERTASSATTEVPPSMTAPGLARRVLACAFVCGAVLLALEVIWFRVLALYVLGTTRGLSLMLAVILGGIGIGGLLASRWLARHDDDAERALPALAAIAGLTAFITYVLLPTDQLPGAREWTVAVGDAVRLALPTSLVSGALFAVLGTVARRAYGSETRATGALVVANTLGAMTGALLAGFVLMPRLGADGGCFVACALYGIVALAVPRAATRSRRAGIADLALPVSLAGCLALFPFGHMQGRVFQLLANVTSGDRHVAAYREGLMSTITVVEHRWQGGAVAHQLITDGFSMSGTHYNGRRYMKLFVYLPVALRPDPTRALLICYGVGQTAKALTDTASLEQIDVVDISEDILELAPVSNTDRGTAPLVDPRVRVHVEDGRFFLQTSTQRYDVITGEPPPPQVAGVVNLYTREYFALVRDHLTDRGITTYWLPVHSLSLRGTRSIVRAFCSVFADCTLWTGFGREWMLVGSRGITGPVSEEEFTRQWRDPRVGPELRAVGLEQPEQLGATFMADATTLAAWTADAPILDDDHPARIDHAAETGDSDLFRWMETGPAHERFRASSWVTSLWPPALRERTLPYFAIQDVVNRIGGVTTSLESTSLAELAKRLDDVHRVQSTSTLRTLVLWLFGYTAAHERIMDAQPTPGDGELQLARGVRALADRNFDEAASRFDIISPQTPHLVQLARYAHAMAGSAPP